MKKWIIEKNFPSLYYIIIRWPKSKSIICKYFFSDFRKPNFSKLLNSLLIDHNFQKKKPLLNVLVKLSSICHKNVNSNKYHDQHHTKAVLILSCLFAKKRKIKNYDYVLIIILALAHDMNHQGRRVLHKPYYQERKTIGDLEKILFKSILNNNTWNRVSNILLNTYFPIEPIKINDYLEDILLTADIASSVIFGSEVGLKLAKKLKHEININDRSDLLYENFLKRLKLRKFIYLENHIR